jgi:hypothetical protein
MGKKMWFGFLIGFWICVGLAAYITLWGFFTPHFAYVSRCIWSIPARFVTPSSGACERCNMPWSVVEGHCTPYGDTVVATDKDKDGKFEAKLHGSNITTTGDGILGIQVSGGCFPLCQSCWQELTPKYRVKYYRALWDSWHSEHDRLKLPQRDESEWESMKKSVLAGN